MLLEPLHQHRLLPQAWLTVKHQRFIEFGLGMFGKPLLDAQRVPRKSLEDPLVAVVLNSHCAGTAVNPICTRRSWCNAGSPAASRRRPRWNSSLEL
ncbi:unnamed protein product [Sphagnum jensenii]